MSKTTANELTRGKVQFISLVDHGANREPFRLVKRKSGEDNMAGIDLGVFAFRKKDKVLAPPSVGFIAVAKTYSMEEASGLVTQGGFTVDNVEEQETGYLFKQEGFRDEDDYVAVKLNDHVFIGVADMPETLTKGFEGYNWQSGDFKEVFSQEGALPMVSIACSALMDTIYNTMGMASSPADAAKLVKAALSDFTEVVLGTVKAIPVNAFKLEDVVLKADAPKGEIAATTDSTKKGDPAPAPAAAEPAPEPAAEAAPVAAEKSDPEAAPEPAADAPATVAKTAEPDGLAAVMAAIEKMSGVVEGVAKKQDEQGTALTSLTEQVAATSAGLKKMDDVLGSGIVGADTEEDPEVTRKGDRSDNGQFGLIDTGFSDPFVNDKKAERDRRAGQVARLRG